MAGEGPEAGIWLIVSDADDVDKSSITADAGRGGRRACMEVPDSGCINVTENYL